MDDLQNVPPVPGAFIFWLDEAPPKCLFVGIASPKLEDGLREQLLRITDANNQKSELHNNLMQDNELARLYKINLKKPDNRQQFLLEHVYFQYLTIPDMKEDEMISFREFLEEASELNPRFLKISAPPKRKGK